MFNVQCFRSLHKPVADAADGVQMLRRRAELFAQPAHVRVHRARVNQAVVFPHVAQQMVARLHAPGALRERGEQLEFRRRQINRLAFPAGQWRGTSISRSPKRNWSRGFSPVWPRERIFLMRSSSSRGLNGLVR